MDGWNTIVSFWDGLFSEAMLVSRRVGNFPEYISITPWWDCIFHVQTIPSCWNPFFVGFFPCPKTVSPEILWIKRHLVEVAKMSQPKVCTPSGDENCLVNSGWNLVVGINGGNNHGFSC